MNWKINYPSRYYAHSNTDALLGGYPTVGWVDISIFTNKPDWLPAASEMIALTEDQWNSRVVVSQIIENGTIKTYTATATTT